MLKDRLHWRTAYSADLVWLATVSSWTKDIFYHFKCLKCIHAAAVGKILVVTTLPSKILKVVFHYRVVLLDVTEFPVILSTPVVLIIFEIWWCLILYEAVLRPDNKRIDGFTSLWLPMLKLVTWLWCAHKTWLVILTKAFSCWYESRGNTHTDTYIKQFMYLSPSSREIQAILF